MNDLKVLWTLIGKPYRAGGTGPDAYDCYGLANEVRRRLGMLALPTTPRGLIRARRGWRRIYQPSHGALVVMGAADRDRHVGIALTGGNIIHCLEIQGVTVDDMGALRFRGFSNIRFWIDQ